MSEPLKAITMPKWGLAMEEGQLTAWLVEEGQAVGLGDEVVEIETTKITNVLECAVAGTLLRKVAAEGETLPVGALLGVVGEESPSAAIDAFIEEFNAAFATAAAAAAEEGVPEPAFIEVEGRQLCTLKMGDGDATPIVLVHGFGGDLNNWLFNQPVLAESGPVYAFDLPGHGRSSKDVGPGSLESLSSSLQGLLQVLEIPQAHLVGHSLGGAIVLELALREPGLVAGVSLLAPAGLAPDINQAYIDGFLAANRRKEMKSALQLLFADAELVSRDMINDLLKFKRLDGVDAALRQISEANFPAGRQARSMADRLNDLTMPVQVLWGEGDQILEPVSSLPGNVDRHRLPGVGHMPQMEAAAEVNRLIGGLLS